LTTQRVHKLPAAADDTVRIMRKFQVPVFRCRVYT